MTNNAATSPTITVDREGFNDRCPDFREGFNSPTADFDRDGGNSGFNGSSFRLEDDRERVQRTLATLETSIHQMRTLLSPASAELSGGGSRVGIVSNNAKTPAVILSHSVSEGKSMKPFLASFEFVPDVVESRDWLVS